MEPEVKDIIFDTNLKQIQQEMKDTANVAQMMGKSFKENSTMNVDWSKYDVQGISQEDVVKEIEKLNEQLEIEKNRLESIKDLDLGGFSATAELSEKKIATINQQISNLQSYLDSTKEKAEEAGDKAEDIGKKVQVSFKGGIKFLTKFMLGLIGIRTVWSVLTRASHQYMEENKEINASLKLTFSIIGNLIGPAIKGLVGVVEYLAIIIAKVVQSLTGYNVLAKVSANATKDLAKQAKKAHNALAGFDTITNLSQNDNAMEGYAASLEAFNEFQEKAGEIEKFWNKWGDWVTGGLIGLGSAAVLGSIAKLIGVAGVGGAAGTGLAGVAGLLSQIAIPVGVIIACAVSGYLQVKELREEMDKIVSDQAIINNKKNRKNIKDINTLLKSQAVNLKSAEDSLGESYSFLTSILGLDKQRLKAIESEVKTNESNVEQYKEYIKLEDASLENIQEIYDLSNRQLNVNKLLKNNYETQGKDTQFIKENTEKYNSILSEIKEKYEIIDGKVVGIKDETKKLNDIKLNDKSMTVNINGNTKDLENKTNNWFKTFTSGIANWLNTNMFGTALSTAFNVGKKVFGSILKFDVGTNYVPQDQLAVVHKGEMIVPAKYNPMTSGIGGSNEETNALLRQLNETLENKQFNGYISANDITNTAINGINQQSRIMGRSVIR